MDEERRSAKQGIGLLIACYSAWGLLPLYWKFLANIPSDQILAHRIFWSFLFVTVLIFAQGRWPEIKAVFRSKKNILALFLCSLFISSNWYIYIWAVNHGHIVETSLGYYINPLLSVALGIIVLRERLTFWQVVSFSLAAIGVTVLTVEYGKFPWIGLSLATTFAVYGLAKKLVKVDSLTGLTMETFMAMPFALAYILYVEINGTGLVGNISWLEFFVLLCSGVVTALPLLWFARGAKAVAMSTVGFFQYLSPTIQLFLGIFVYHETFSYVHAISFSFIWLGLLLYTLSFTGLLGSKRKTVAAKAQKTL
ncbi:EamA family transporter RarD [Brevibacillus fluminis]|uniref:EamA family transporter RarD n=1 Tax=Brevibacillus fluminis TaxID=511487 RepID=UPI003F8A922F